MYTIIALASIIRPSAGQLQSMALMAGLFTVELYYLPILHASSPSIYLPFDVAAKEAGERKSLLHFIQPLPDEFIVPKRFHKRRAAHTSLLSQRTGKRCTPVLAAVLSISLPLFSLLWPISVQFNLGVHGCIDHDYHPHAICDRPRKPSK